MTGYTDSGDETREPPAPITPAERAAWQAACTEATPGPWGVEVADVGSGIPEWAAVGPPQSGAHRHAYEQAYADARFLAYARTALPRLLAALTTAEGDRMALGQSAQNQAVIIAGLEAEVDRLRAQVLPPPPPYDPTCQTPIAVWNGEHWTQNLGNTE